ncbi:sensor histidine kinase [Nitratiruptor tergarcus]|uniref:histidine kinase n=1 Tax=Nitratiruptor tergarcus DSM 16512 TaxID=1069081 RepID=A0A1W1WUY7_9BACT|nr:HAMP domain-containing sensor histidine kinase [Nitratiruptor tergarcus]SMC09999.1 two-component system, OmpR family, sensor kinase [Nitratiruptor tergarcus DSM 16512]
MDTNLTSEKSSLIKFLALYIFLTLIILILASMMYYKFEKEVMLYSRLPKLQEYSKDVIRRIRAMHESLLEDNYYPRYSTFKSAIYDADHVKIFSLLENEHIDFQNFLYKNGSYIHFIKEPSLYYLGAKYVIIEVKDDEIWLHKVYKNIVLFGSLFLLFMGLVGYFLVKQFLKPMKNSFILLNNFIKDTTHELNTPVSTILTNIETIDKNELPPKINKKLNRIEIAARTISVIYKDLVYLLLKDKFPSTLEKIDINALLSQRIDYFKSMAESKKIKISFSQSPCFLEADKQKITRLIDNLLSNAIKYNKIGGTIKIKTFSRGFYIEDSGIGIPEEKIGEIFKRYKRLSSSEGGFGIGLHIVLSIANEFGLKIKVDSKVNQYTRITITW